MQSRPTADSKYDNKFLYNQFRISNNLFFCEL